VNVTKVISLGTNCDAELSHPRILIELDPAEADALLYFMRNRDVELDHFDTTQDVADGLAIALNDPEVHAEYVKEVGQGNTDPPALPDWYVKEQAKRAKSN
jgi:hypothetical protein